jgi:hypothetical protein
MLAHTPRKNGQEHKLKKQSSSATFGNRIDVLAAPKAREPEKKLTEN